MALSKTHPTSSIDLGLASALVLRLHLFGRLLLHQCVRVEPAHDAPVLQRVLLNGRQLPLLPD